MNAPRLEVDLDRIHHNACTLVEQLSARGISVTGVTKAGLGSPHIADAYLGAGIRTLGDSRIENIETMRHARIAAQMVLIRSPMLSQVDRVVATTDVSFNTELDVIAGLSTAARKSGRSHGVLLMVELGDLREGIMPSDVDSVVRKTLNLPNIVLRGIGTNLACRSGVSPDSSNMSQLSALADSLERTFGLNFDIVSGGNSANLDWALGAVSTGRINNLRLGEALLLGRETLHRQPIEGLYTDAITLVAEVIEAKIKPSRPWGDIAQNAFAEKAVVIDQGDILQAILAIGRQDIDPQGLYPPPGVKVIDASSDHLIVQSVKHKLEVGKEITFQLNYSALTRAMTSSFVTKLYLHKEMFSTDAQHLYPALG